MTDSTTGRTSTGSWWWALAALAICAPWPGWTPDGRLLAVVVALMLVLARPVGHWRWPWLGVALALAGVLAPAGREADERILADGLDAHCREMLATAGAAVGDPRLNRLFTVTGEALDPAQPFEILEDLAQRRFGRAIYLADDRGDLVAWGGAERAYPVTMRPIGPRAWGVEWSAAGAVLHLREPLMIEGRLVGSVTVADHTALVAELAWGMRAPPGSRLVLGAGATSPTNVGPEVAPAVELSVGTEPIPPVERRGLFVLGWLVVAVFGLVSVPRLAWVAVVVPGLMLGSTAVESTVAEQMVLVLVAGAAVGRLARCLPRPWAGAVIVGALAFSAAVRLVGESGLGGSWLPDHLLRPGWGGVWMVALAWVISGWPSLTRGRLTLDRRFAAAVILALGALAVDLAWFPAQAVERDLADNDGVVLPRDEVPVAEIWPADPQRCRSDDAAPVLARSWGLDRWSTPSRLSIVDPGVGEFSSWGDLSPAGDRQHLVRSWPVEGSPGLLVELYVAEEPWSLLEDWDSGEPVQSSWTRPVWSAVLTRSGTVAASLHPEIGNLDPVAAGEIYHASSGWTRIRVDDARLAARVVRRGDWLVAAVVHPPEPPVWVVRTALAVVWAVLGLMLARPPGLRREELATFGGRLRLLVAGGVVIPLVILTLFLQLRLGREEQRLEEVLARDAFEAARYTVEHLGEGVVIDDQLAAWMARGWGGEVALFERTDVAGVSRPDLMAVGRVGQLPAAAAYPLYLLGRSEGVISRSAGRVVASGLVDVADRRYLLQLVRSDPLRTGSAPDAVDWLLTGGLLAALLALIATRRIEDRLSASLRDLVDLAGRLVRGDPVGPVSRPKETDLAEVLDAVRSMNEEVRRRELSLKHQEELLRITLANLAPAVMVMQPEGRVSFANPSAEAILDEHGALVRERIADLAEEIGDEAEVAVTEQPFPGRDLTWRLGLAKVPLPDGRHGMVAVIDDVTEVVRADRLQQLNQLARIVAHEVKNPLTPIRLWIQELTEARRRDDEGLDELLDEACGEIAVQIERLQSTASSFSNLVALEHWRPERVDLAEVVAVCTEGLGVLRRRNIVVRTEVPPAGSVVLTADRQWLTRALANLLQNSLDVLGDGPGEITLRVGSDDGRVFFEIEDSGGGVPEERLPELFVPHFSTTASGSGLGLALVHQVVTRCQGSVEARNGERGLRIRIEMPAD